MQKNLVAAAIIATLAAGCTAKSDTINEQSASSSLDTSNGASPTEVSSTSASGWSLNRETTAMDGEVVSATKDFEFPGQTVFSANMTCKRSNSALQFTIQSTVGDPEKPAEASAFVSEQFVNIFNVPLTVPVARVKVGEKDPVSSDARTYFVMGDYTNEIKFSGASLAEDIPMIVELKNGTGAFQLNIDASDEVTQVLNACKAKSTPEQVASNGDAGATVSQLGQSENSSAAAAEIPSAAAEPSVTPISPSFDCRKAASNTEMLICGDGTLAKLDKAMADNYRAIVAADIGDEAQAQLKAKQREWLKSRDRCTDKSCLVALYRERLDAICDYPVLSGVHPECQSSDDIE